MVLPIASQLMKKFADNDFVANMNYRWERKKLEDSNIEDIYDGEMYKAIEPLNDPKSNNLSLSWNTDGAPIFKSSKF